MPGHGPQDFTTAQSTDRTFRNDNLELGHHIKNVIEHLHRMLNSACEQLHASTEPKAHGTHSRINAEARNLHDSISAMHEELGQIISQASREMAWVTAQKIAEMGSRGVILLVDDVEQDEESMTAVRNKVNVVFNKLRNNLTASWNDWTTGIRRADREVSGECETVVSQAEREDYRRAYPDLTDEVMDAWRSPSPQEDPVPDINPAPDDTNENIRSRFDELFWKTEQWARENAISRIGEGQESDFKDWCMEKKLLIRNDRWLRSSDIDSEVCRHTPLILCAAIANGICHAVLSNSFFFVQGIHPINDHNQVVYRDVDLSMLLQGMAHEICQDDPHAADAWKGITVQALSSSPYLGAPLRAKYYGMVTEDLFERYKMIIKQHSDGEDTAKRDLASLIQQFGELAVQLWSRGDDIRVQGLEHVGGRPYRDGEPLYSLPHDFEEGRGRSVDNAPIGVVVQPSITTFEADNDGSSQHKAVWSIFIVIPFVTEGAAYSPSPSPPSTPHSGHSPRHPTAEAQQNPPPAGVTSQTTGEQETGMPVYPRFSNAVPGRNQSSVTQNSQEASGSALPLEHLTHAQTVETKWDQPAVGATSQTAGGQETTVPLYLDLYGQETTVSLYPDLPGALSYPENHATTQNLQEAYNPSTVTASVSTVAENPEPRKSVFRIRSRW